MIFDTVKTLRGLNNSNKIVIFSLLGNNKFL